MSFPRITPDLGNYQSLEFWLDQLIERRLAAMGALNHYGTFANRPSATASNVLPGSFYTSIDTGQVDQSQNGQWVTVLPAYAITPKARAFLLAPQIVPGATWTRVALDTLFADSGIGFDLPNHRYICPKDGQYLTLGSVMGNFTSGENVATIYKNGNRAANGTDVPASTGFGLLTADIIGCTAGDILELYTYSQAGGTLSGATLGWNCSLAVLQVR